MKKALISASVLFYPMAIWATHSLGGEFRYRHLQNLTYTIEFHYWTCLEAPADRAEVILHFGDGGLDTVPRTSIVDFPDATDCCGVRHSIYVTEHTYDLPGVYTMTMEDANRSSGIINVSNSNSQPFCTSATLLISMNTGPNNSMVFGAGPMDWDYVWSTLVHDPMPTDPDGDSLSFELVTPLGLGCDPIAGYAAPSAQPPGWTWLDPASGAYHWHLPETIGRYVVAIRAKEWRLVNGNWVHIGGVVRDITICVNSIPTGLDASKYDAGPLLRPTLSDGTLWVTNPENTIQWMSILDASGREVLRFPAPPGESAVDLSNLRPSMYLLRITNGRSTRFVRQ
jgi:hypothetical protein